MTAYDYGKCHVCGAPVEERLTEQTIHADQDWILVRSVPTGVCTRCGEQILRWHVAARLEEIIRDRSTKKPDQRIEVPVFAF